MVAVEPLFIIFVREFPLLLKNKILKQEVER